ncbi:hypothetical protein AB0D13_40365 [Streptomyces sp. NPDC048430]|uniref:hypothetical protein n=1 Tax=Streptomyces sp. NPDC048430 TaxID=3155388 RepID=UPI00342FD293
MTTTGDTNSPDTSATSDNSSNSPETKRFRDVFKDHKWVITTVVALLAVIVPAVISAATSDDGGKDDKASTPTAPGLAPPAQTSSPTESSSSSPTPSAEASSPKAPVIRSFPVTLTIGDSYEAIDFDAASDEPVTRRIANDEFESMTEDQKSRYDMDTNDRGAPTVEFLSASGAAALQPDETVTVEACRQASSGGGITRFELDDNSELSNRSAGIRKGATLCIRTDKNAVVAAKIKEIVFPSTNGIMKLDVTVWGS